jgi:Tfp pilus assembly pilus retraction ATPase PilT
MAKALVGFHPAHDQHLVLETLELRRRVRDLERLVERLKQDNDQLREDLAEDLRQPDALVVGAPTIAG